MAFSYNKKNLANTTITGAITPTQTSVTVADATVFSYAFFYATLMPSNEMSNASNSEIVLVTNIQGNTLTLVRGQENTIARSFPYGAVITNGIYTRDIDYARSIGRKVFMARDDGTDDTNTSYQIIDPMIKNVPEEGSIITVEFDVPSYGAPTLGVNNGVGGLVQVSGTDIHITDSSGQIDSVEMYGETEQQTYTGKNLLNITKGTFTQNGITFTQNPDGSVTMNGTSTGNAYYEMNNTTASQTTITSGVRYTLSVGNTPLPSGQVVVQIRKVNPNTVYAAVTDKSASFTAPETTATFTYIGVYGSGVVLNNVTIYPMLEVGSSMTSFEPYVGGTASPNPDYPQEVQTVTGEQTVTVSDGQGQSQEYEVGLVGKNLFDKDKTPEYKYIDANGNWAVGTYPDVNQEYKATGGEKFTFSFSSATGIAYIRFAQFDGNGVFIQRALINTSPTTITLQENTRKVIWSVDVSEENYFTNLQIERGATATAYTPYVEPIELCKIGTYQDYIYKSGEDWYVHKEINQLVLNGSESWETTGTNVYALYVSGGIKSVAQGLLGVSNYYTFNPVQASVTATLTAGQFAIQFINPNTQHRLFMKNTAISTTSDFQTWLSSHNTTVYYPLATATDTQITNSALIAQLEALYNMLPEGVADVVVTGDLPGSLTIKYYQQGTGTYTAPIVGGAEIDGGDNEQVVELDSYLPYRLVYDTNGYWRVLNKGPKVTTGAIADGAVTAAKITRDNINYGTTSGDIRIGTFDGKPLWRRVQKFTNIPTGYSVHNWTAGTIANLNSIVAVNGMWAASGSTTYVPINSLPPDAVTTYGIAIRDFTASSWAVVLGTSMSTVNSGYIILDYTKTS